MKFKTITIIIFIVFTVFSLCSCRNTNKTQQSSLNETKPENDVINIPSSIRKNQSFVLNKFVQEKYGKPDIVRNFKDYSYEIRNMDDGSKLFVFYSEQYVVEDIWRLKKLLKQEDFKDIECEKSTSKDILQIDPYTSICGNSTGKAVSEHKLYNNKIAIIEYSKDNGSWIVKNIRYIDPDPSKFTSKLLPEDLKIISE